MAERQLPGLGLWGQWDRGADYKDGMESNLLLLSALCQCAVIDGVDAEPSSPTQGQVYKATAAWATGAINDIMVYDGDAWTAISPSAGWIIYDEAASAYQTFDGTAWGALDTGGSEAFSAVASAAADRVLAAADFLGSVYIRCGYATANTVTVPAGLAAAAPVTVVQTGDGTTSFVASAGVTINSRDGNLGLAGKWASATLLPVGADEYDLIGALG